MSSSAGPLALVVVALALGLPLSEGASERTVERSYFAHLATPGAPSSDAVRTGNTLYLAGHLGLDPATGEAPSDSASEARLLMQGIERTMAGAGFRVDDLVAVTVFSTDAGLNGTFNAVYEATSTSATRRAPSSARVRCSTVHTSRWRPSRCVRGTCSCELGPAGRE